MASSTATSRPAAAKCYGRVAKIGIDPEANEAYFADGYYNKRIAVVDVETGAFKRGWGAYGNVPDDGYDFGGPYEPGKAPAQQFRGPVHCGEISNDGLVYVCDRAEGRVQVFGVNYFGRLATIILAGSDRRGSRSTAVGLWTVWAVLAPSKAGEGNALSRRNKPARRPPRHRPADGGSRLAPTPTRRSGAPSPNRRTARRPRVVDGRDAPVQAGPQGP